MAFLLPLSSLLERSSTLKCSLDIEIAPDSPLLHDPAYQDILEKYSYTDSTGYLVLCWDLGKYVNHCCHFNTISTAYGCDIAFRDIQPGEELTSEYALYTFDREMELICHYPDCRKRLTPQDFEHYWPLWDASAREAIDRLPEVEQPLLKYLDPQATSRPASFPGHPHGLPLARAFASRPRPALTLRLPIPSISSKV